MSSVRSHDVATLGRSTRAVRSAICTFGGNLNDMAAPDLPNRTER
jgi:hypothetical protein